MSLETLDQKIARVVKEEITIVDADPRWAELFGDEKAHLRSLLPSDLLIRIEHFGSSAVPGLVAKPIVDMVIEITDEDRGKECIPQILEPLGYDCFWRPQGNVDEPPYFTWCIKRDSNGVRTHHLHFVTAGSKDTELRFRDILRAHPDIARAYGEMKQQMCALHKYDRVGYTEAKGDFIHGVLQTYGA